MNGQLLITKIDQNFSGAYGINLSFVMGYFIV
jgi:hypothetical protein